MCPFLDDTRCTRREKRALACRIYHCEASSRDEMQSVSEAWLRRLKGLHDRFDLPWHYARVTAHL